MSVRLTLVSLCALLLVGCATGPGFSGDHINLDLQPRGALAADAAVRGQTVLWGGRIIQTVPEEGVTTVEVLAFPLRGNQQPNTGMESQGRFLVVHPGYLEPADFSADRLITVVGTLEASRSGQVGEAEYRYPVVRVDSLHLWPLQREQSEPRVHFGIGVGISR